jgi:ATP-binding cassette, subfamily B, bacterial PglK
MTFIILINKIYLILKEIKVKNIFLSIILLFFVSVLELIGISFVIPIFDILTGRENTFLQPYLKNHSTLDVFIFVIISLVFFFFIKSFVVTLINYKVFKLCFKSQEKLSAELFKKFLTQDYEFYVQRNSADLIRTIATESRMFSFICIYYFSFFSEIFIFILIVGFLFYLYPLATTTSFFVSIILILVFYKLIKEKSLKMSSRRVSNEELYLKTAQEAFNNIKTIKMHLTEGFFINRFSEKIHTNSITTFLQNFYASIPRMWIEFFAVITLVSAIAVHLSFLNLPFNDSLALIALYSAASFKLVPSVTKLMYIIQFFFNSSASINLMYKELTHLKSNYLESIEKNNDNSNFSFVKNIEIKNLHFKYDTRKDKLFNNLSFKINKHEFIGLKGPSGIGKSTLVDLLSGIKKPDEGDINIDGKSIYFFLKEWRKKVAIVSQSTTLIDDSLKNNIAFGINEEKIDLNNINKKIKLANLDEFVKNLPEGLNTNIGQAGIKISGGQIQRIGIARALYVNPEFLILDEPTSSLDSKSEQQIYETIKNLKSFVTVLIISHKENISDICDKVYKISNGEIKKL